MILPIDSGERYVKYGLSEEGILFLFNTKKASFMHSSCSRMGNCLQNKRKLHKN
jgi:hypothetical protein